LNRSIRIFSLFISRWLGTKVQLHHIFLWYVCICIGKLHFTKYGNILFVCLIGVVCFFHWGGKCCVDFLFFYFFIWFICTQVLSGGHCSFAFFCLFILIFFSQKIRMLIVGILKWTNVSFHFQYIRKNSGGRKYVHKD